jgi:hypothetical protein
MQPPEGIALPLPKIYWDAFQSTVQAQTRRLAKEIASKLRQSENPLLQALQSEKVNVYLFEEEGSEYVDLERMRCDEMRRSVENPSILEKCGQPIVMGRGKKCPCHLHAKRQPILESYQRLRIVKDCAGKKYWLAKDNILLNSDMTPVGRYEPNTNRLFVFDTDE